MNFLRDSDCIKCGKPTSKWKLVFFIFTFRYKCNNCDSYYTISSVSALFLGVFAVLGIFVFDIEKHIYLPAALVTMGLIASVFSPLKRLSFGDDVAEEKQEP